MADLMLAPVELTDTEIDAVSGGQPTFQDGLVNVAVGNVNVAIPVTAAVSAGLLNNQSPTTSEATAPGNITQRNRFL